MGENRGVSRPNLSMTEFFSNLTDDLVLGIFIKLEDDPRHWARLACVSTKISSLIRNVLWKEKCLRTIPSVVFDLINNTTSSDPPGGWAALFKLSVCCPGLRHAGVLLENSDFGLERELGPDENFVVQPSQIPSSSRKDDNLVSKSESCWSLYDDLYLDTIYNASESRTESMDIDGVVGKVGSEGSDCSKRKKKCRSIIGAHLATGVRNLRREHGNKLLASRFRGDCLYICDWPGCVHTEEKRSYMLFRGFFKNFQRSQVWRTIKDGKRSKIALDCAFCSCKETWDLHSAFCLRRVFGYHDDGEPVVRAYVCENGHVSGAWTDRPMYS